MGKRERLQTNLVRRVSFFAQSLRTRLENWGIVQAEWTSRLTLEDQLKKAKLNIVNHTLQRPTMEEQIADERYRKHRLSLPVYLNVQDLNTDDSNLEIHKLVFREYMQRSDVRGWKTYKERRGLKKDPE
jgi:hypothetical protein